MAGIKRRKLNDGNESLPAAWEVMLQKNFTVFSKLLKAQDIAKFLFSEMVLTPQQFDEIKAMTTDYDKTDYMINKVLLRSSRYSLAKFKLALKETGQSYLIEHLPSDLPYTYDGRRTEYRYRRLREHKGLCVIFGFFVTELRQNDCTMPGYEIDMTNLGKKFEELDFSVDVNRNLRKEEFWSNLKRVQTRLVKEDIDRFVLIVLSHGCQKGVYTNADSRGTSFEYDTHRNMQFVSYRDIRNLFTHDKVSSLKGFPKFLMFQCCRGEKQVRTASHNHNVGYNPEINPETFGIEADVLTSYATGESYVSAVHHVNGSWFIQDFLRAMDELDPETHEVEQILRRASFYVSERQHPIHQTSVYNSTLRKSFYLKDDYQE